MREARGWHGRAMLAVARGQEALEAWDPEANRIRLVAEWQQEMALDRDGCLRRSREATRRAARLARTPGERGRVTAWQARLECDTGDHQAELQLARRLMTLEPQSERSLLWLRRAARCNGLKGLEQQADRKLTALRSQS